MSLQDLHEKLKASLHDSLKDALTKVTQGRVPAMDRDVARTTLQTAMAQAQRVDRNSMLKGAIPDDRQVALVLSGLRERLNDQQLPQPEMAGFGEYEDLDVRWIKSLVHRMVSPRVGFPTHVARQVTPTVRIADSARIAIAGDWGTGNDSSRAIAAEIAALHVDHTIHLGDVYYSGTADEEEANFLALWPPGTSTTAPSFALNGNHDMYSGGDAYFSRVLGAPQFAAQQWLSYFALENSHWTILGADSAYWSEDYLYQHGDLGETHAPQVAWLRDTARTARAQQKRVVLLTHHHGLDIDPERNRVTFERPFWDRVRDVFDGGPDFWYWGHVHAGIAYDPIEVDGHTMHVRCVGHGGVPYAPFPNPKQLHDQGITVAWAETQKALDDDEPRRAANGFLTLRFDDAQLVEEFRDEHGAVRATFGW